LGRNHAVKTRTRKREGRKSNLWRAMGLTIWRRMQDDNQRGIARGNRGSHRCGKRRNRKRKSEEVASQGEMHSQERMEPGIPRNNKPTQEGEKGSGNTVESPFRKGTAHFCPIPFSFNVFIPDWLMVVSNTNFKSDPKVLILPVTPTPAFHARTEVRLLSASIFPATPDRPFSLLFFP